MRTARAWAWLSGRDFVTPDDVKALAQATLAHRLVAAARGRARGRRRQRRPRLRARLRPGPPLTSTMAITGRVPLLLLLGLVAVVLRPSIGTMWLWVLVVVAARRARRGAGALPGRITVERLPVDRVRAGSESASTLVVGNDGARRTTVLVRDAWQPTAGATRNRHRLRLAPGDRTLRDHLAAPRAAGRAARVGRHPADRRTARARGATGHPRGARAGPVACLPSSPASTCPRGSPGSATSTAGRPSGCAARGRSSTRCVSTSAATTSAPSTGGPPPATAPSWCAPGSPSATGGWCSCSTPRASRPGGSPTCRGSTPRWRRRCC